MWTKRVERLADSGLTAKEFATEIGVNANTLAGWKWRLSRSGVQVQGEQTRKGPARLGLVAALEDGPGGGSLAAGDQRPPRAVAAPEAPIAPMKFVELTTRASATPRQAAYFEIVLRSGRVVRVPGGFDAAELARLLGVLEEVRS